MLKRICLVRHGQAATQDERRYCGHSDPPLTAVGEAQVRALRPQLAAEVSPEAALVSSDRARAIKTALVLFNCTVAVNSDWREIHFGDWEGLRFDQTGCTDVEQLRAPDFQYPNGECTNMLLARVQRALDHLLVQNADEAVVVAHAGSLAAAQVLLLGSKPESLPSYFQDHATRRWLNHGPVGWRAA